jgi:hypothetical protein
MISGFFSMINNLNNDDYTVGIKRFKPAIIAFVVILSFWLFLTAF